MGKKKRIDIEKYLEEEELTKLVENAKFAKESISWLYVRIGKPPRRILCLSNNDTLIDTKGAEFILRRGKTGERRVMIIAYVSLLQQWLNIHPLKNQSEFPLLWISEATYYKIKINN